MDNEISTNLEQKAETPTIEPKDENQMVQSALMKAGTQASTLKEAIDIGVTGTITKNSIKLIVGLLVALFIVAVGAGCYFGIPLLLSRY